MWKSPDREQPFLFPGINSLPAKVTLLWCLLCKHSCQHFKGKNINEKYSFRPESESSRTSKSTKVMVNHRDRLSHLTPDVCRRASCVCVCLWRDLRSASAAKMWYLHGLQGMWTSPTEHTWAGQQNVKREAGKRVTSDGEGGIESVHNGDSQDM